MGAYRITRNIEISTKDFISTNLNIDWSNPTINVYRSWGEVSGNNLPCVTVRSGTPTHNRVEVGSFSTRRETLLLIDVFAKNEGQLLDLVDYLVDKLKKSWTYKEITVTDGVSSSVDNGLVTCLTITPTPVSLNINKSELDKVDRHRYLISISCTTNKVES